MDALSRTRRVTGDAERFIGDGGPAKHYVFRNLGPADIRIKFWASTTASPSEYPLRTGDDFEAYCAIAEAWVDGEPALNVSILQWAPVD